MSPLQWLREHTGHSNPLVAASNETAVLIASNQPFYPLYIWYLIGSNGALLSLLTLLSTLLFVLTPLVSRYDTCLSRAVPVLAGAANTLMCVQIFGLASGVELFLIPCVMLAALSYSRADRVWALTLIGLIAIAYIGLRLIHVAPWAELGGEDNKSLFKLHAFSVAGLSAYIAWTFFKVYKARFAGR